MTWLVGGSRPSHLRTHQDVFVLIARHSGGNYALRTDYNMKTLVFREKFPLKVNIFNYFPSLPSSASSSGTAVNKSATKP